MMQIPILNPKEVNAMAGQAKIVDVRRPDEFKGELGHIPGSMLVTLETDLETYLERLPKDETYIFVCKSGGRSGRAAEIAQARGFKNVFNMVGGMIAWNQSELAIER